MNAQNLRRINKERDFFSGAEKVRKMSVDFRNELWYVVLLTKGG
jgi:hypothetical protein